MRLISHALRLSRSCWWYTLMMDVSSGVLIGNLRSLTAEPQGLVYDGLGSEFGFRMVDSPRV